MCGRRRTGYNRATSRSSLEDWEQKWEIQMKAYENKGYLSVSSKSVFSPKRGALRETWRSANEHVSIKLQAFLSVRKAMLMK
jgi:outer membrane biogenesis lipoprotein LolB